MSPPPDAPATVPPRWLSDGPVARVFFGTLPVALILVESLAVETRRGVKQLAGAACGSACGGVDDRLLALQYATTVLALVVTGVVALYWHWAGRFSGSILRRQVAIGALSAFALAAAVTPWRSVGIPISLVALFVAIAAQATTGEGAASASRLSFEGVLRLRGVRIAVIVIVIYAVFLLVIPQSSPQAIDAILAWSSHRSYVCIGVASAVLLALVVHDSALLLAHPAQRGGPSLGSALDELEPWERVALAALGAGIVVVLAILAMRSYVVWLSGVIFPALLISLLGLLRWCDSEDEPRARPDIAVGRQIAAWLRLIAQIPLVLFSAAVSLALVEAVLAGDGDGIVLLVFALVLLIGGLVLLERAERDDGADAEAAPLPFDRPALFQTQWWAAVIATVAVADQTWSGVAGLALIVTLVVLGLHLWRRRSWPQSVERTRSWYGLRYLGLVPLVALPVSDLSDWPGIGLAVSLATIAIAIAWWLAAKRPGPAWAELKDTASTRGLGLPAARGAGIALLLGALLNVETTASVVGTIAAVNLAAAAAIALLHSLVARFDSQRFPERRWTRWGIANKRVPILTLLAAWVVVAIVVAPPSSHRMLVTARVATPAPTIDQAVTAFLSRPAPAASPGNARPVLLVASDGGGARASYWTALVLDCVIAARPPQKTPSATVCSDGRDAGVGAQLARARTMLVASGVSGGGVGLAQYAAALVAGRPNGLPRRWAEDVAGFDMLRAPTTWGVAHDLVAGLLGVHAPDEHCLRVREGDEHNDVACRLVASLTRDRGNVLAEAIAGRGGHGGLPSIPLRSVMPTETNELPVFIDNATLTGGVARVVASPLDLAARLQNNVQDRQNCGDLLPRDVACQLFPCTDGKCTIDCATANDPACDIPPVARARDLVNVLGQRRDMPLMAAATLGARFPIITSPAYVASCGNSGVLEFQSGDRCESGSSMSDGGFLENSGLLTIRELLPRIRNGLADWNSRHPDEAPYALYVVELDNHARSATDAGEINSARVATTVLNLTSARDFIEGYARESVIDFVGSSCYLRVHPTASAAVSAPTGWLLSDDAERGLRDTLKAPAPKTTSRTYDAVRRLIRWIDGDRADRGCVPFP